MKTTKNTNTVKGPIGMAVNGVALFGNADDLNRDAYEYEGSAFDSCFGHAEPHGKFPATTFLKYFT